MFRGSLGLVAVFLLVAASASAESITYTFRGTIDFAGGSVWNLGDQVSGFYRFDSTTPGVVPSDGIGRTYNAITGFIASVGSSLISGSSGTISVHLDEPALGGESGYDVHMGRGSAGSSRWDVYLSVFDLTGFTSLVTDESIQTWPPRVTDVTSATGTILGRGGEYGFSLDRLGRRSVPEPSTSWLVGIGVMGMAALRVFSSSRDARRLRSPAKAHR